MSPPCITIELTVERPFLDLGLYRNAPFVIASIATFLVAHLLTEAGELGGAATTKALVILREHLFLQAEMAAYQDTFLLLCAITLLALLPAMLSRKTREGFGKQSNG